MLKYCVGLDVSAQSLSVCISVIDFQQKVTVKSSCKVTNSGSGFIALEKWIAKFRKDQQVPLSLVMEATGVYYEECAMYFYQKGYNVSVVLPNKAKKYIQASGSKSKNDKADAQGLARMGAEQSLELWQPLGEFFYQLRSLTRQQQSIQESKTVFSNQLHAAERGMYQNKFVLKQLRKSINSLDKQIEDVKLAIKEHIASNKDVEQRVKNICHIKGVDVATIAVIVAETNGFCLFHKAGQLVSYSGYDVIENQSGKHTGRTKISKQGNSHIRRALFMPSLSVVRHQEKPFIDLFERTFAKHQIKKKSYVAVQKKLLVIMFYLWKRNEPFNKDYINKYTETMEIDPPFQADRNEVSKEQKKVALQCSATQGKNKIHVEPYNSSFNLQI